MTSVAIGPQPILEIGGSDRGAEPVVDFTEVVESAGGTAAEVEQAEALVWLSYDDIDGFARVLEREGSHLRWIQLPWAGIEPFAHLLDDQRIWTCAKGAYARPVAEHALALLLAGLRQIPTRVMAHSWGPESGRRLDGSHVVILGGGGIGQACIEMLKGFEVTTTVLSRSGRSIAGASRVGTLADLHDVLPVADAVVLALPLTAETAGVISSAELKLLPDHAWVINVARGRHIVTDDLVEALDSGWIAGAGLDVTDPEPLPDGHPLWGRSNCIITPHVADTSAMAVPLLARRVSENVARFSRGEQLVGVVDPSAGY